MVRIHREPPVEGPPGGAVAYTHFGARLARLGRFNSCTLYQSFAPVVQRTRTVGLHPTDAGSTPERRTSLMSRISSKVEPAVDNREVLVRFQHPAPILCCARVTGRAGSCTGLLSETRLVRFQRHPPEFAGLADMDMHSPFKRDEVVSIPTSRTNSYEEAA